MNITNSSILINLEKNALSLKRLTPICYKVKFAGSEVTHPSLGTENTVNLFPVLPVP